MKSQMRRGVAGRIRRHCLRCVGRNGVDMVPDVDAAYPTACVVPPGTGRRFGRRDSGQGDDCPTRLSVDEYFVSHQQPSIALSRDSRVEVGWLGGLVLAGATKYRGYHLGGNRRFCRGRKQRVEIPRARRILVA